jgi:predicted small lipoprotein YifL
MNAKPWIALLACGALAVLAGCEKKGPLEQAGEEVDEAVETVKQGEEPADAKVDDVIDEAREGAGEMKDEAAEDRK